jgi:hypothetical protein
VAAAVVAIQALLILWFAWPAQKAAPRDLPIVVAGPGPAAATVADRIRAERPGAFRVTTVADTAAADQALRERSAYAALVLDSGDLSLHVASAAAPAVATLLSQAIQELGNGRPVRVVDIVPAPADDPRGAGFASGFLPLVLTSLACGIALLLAIGSPAARLIGLLTFAVLGGLVATAAMHTLGILTGNYLSEAAVIGLLALAVAAAVSGLGAVLGPPGLGLGALLVFVIGNPISGLATAPELLPTSWGAIGQLLPPGAGATALRSVAFFDGARASGPLWTLAGWALAGLVLTGLAQVRARTTRRVDEDRSEALTTRH